MRYVVAGLVLIVFLVVGGLVVLTNSSISPPTEKVEQLVPDSQLPR